LQNLSFENVLREYQGLLGRVASSYEHNEALQQELLQEIAVAVWQALPKFQGKAGVKTYVLKIAHNRAVSHVVHHTKNPKAETYFEDTQVSQDSGFSCPEHNQARQQQLQILLNAVRTLPLKTRQVVTLSLEGLSYREISEVTGMNTNQIGVTLNRAKATLSEIVQHD